MAIHQLQVYHTLTQLMWCTRKHLEQGRIAEYIIQKMIVDIHTNKMFRNDTKLKVYAHSNNSWTAKASRTIMIFVDVLSSISRLILYINQLEPTEGRERNTRNGVQIHKLCRNKTAKAVKTYQNITSLSFSRWQLTPYNQFLWVTICVTCLSQEAAYHICPINRHPWINSSPYGTCLWNKRCPWINSTSDYVHGITSKTHIYRNREVWK